VEVEFRSKKLAKSCADDRARVRAYGSERAKKLKLRLSSLVAASCLEDLRNAPGRLHELSGDRAGEFAADLDGPFRLVFEPVVSDAERDHHSEGWVWSKISRIRILGIEDYHG